VLFHILLPVMAIDCSPGWEGSREHPEMNDVLHVLNQIFRDFNSGISIKGLK